MDEIIRDLLEASSDGSQRAAAQARLDNRKKSSPREYLIMMAKILGDDSKEPAARQLAGFQWKNWYRADNPKTKEEKAKQWLSLSPELRNNMKNCTLKAIQYSDPSVSRSAGQVIAEIAVIELPVGQWGDLVRTLLGYMKSDSKNPVLMVSVLNCLEFICEEIPEIDPNFMVDILNTMTTGMKKEVGNAQVILAATQSFEKALHHIQKNMESEQQRNYIMRVVCGTCQIPSAQIRERGLMVLGKMIPLYYDYLPPYIKHILGITLTIMKKDSEDIAKQAVEFWSTLCDHEYNLYDQMGPDSDIKVYDFVSKLMPTVVPVLLELMVRSELLSEDESDTYDLPAACAVCLNLIAGTVGSKIIPLVAPFIQEGIKDSKPTKREASLMAFGCFLEGPETKEIQGQITPILPTLVSIIENDSVLEVRDTAVWALGRVCEFHPDLVSHPAKLKKIMQVFCQCLGDSVGIAKLACLGIHHLALNLADPESSKLDPLFGPVISALLKATEREGEDQFDLRSAAFEAIGNMVEGVSKERLDLIERLCKNFIERLQKTFSMRAQTNAEIENRLLQQGYICSVLLIIVHKLDARVKPYASQMINLYVQIFQASKGSPYVHEDALMAVGSVANALHQDFIDYVPRVMPFLQKGLGAIQQHAVCTSSVGAVGDIFRSVGEDVARHCSVDEIMKALVNAVANPALDRSVKPHILSCFGDIAFVIGAHFEKYLERIVKILLLALKTKKRPDDIHYNEYVDQLREGILDAFTGILQAFQNHPKPCHPFATQLFEFLEGIWPESKNSFQLQIAIIGVIGDIAVTYHEFARQFLTRATVRQIIVSSQRSEDESLREIAKWAYEKISDALRNS